jgi:HEAT repeat protein
MRRRALAICILLATCSGAARAQFKEDELVKDYAKTLARDRDAKERVEAARWLGGRKQPEAVAALAKALSDPDASVRRRPRRCGTRARTPSRPGPSSRRRSAIPSPPWWRARPGRSR